MTSTMTAKTTFLELSVPSVLRTLAALGLLLLVPACRMGPDLEGCRIVGAKTDRDPAGDFVVTVLVENSSPTPLDLEDLAFELSTFDRANNVLTQGESFFVKGEIQRFDIDRIPLHTADAGQRITHARVVLKDRRGNELQDFPVGPQEPAGGPPAAHVPGYR